MNVQETRRMDELEDRMIRIYPMVYAHQERLDFRSAMEFDSPRSGINKWDILLIAAAIGLMIVSYYID